MTIGELARQSNIPASTIRYWESLGALPAPARVSGQRHPALRWLAMAEKKQQELDLQIERLKRMRNMLARVKQCQCIDLRDCGRRAASAVQSTPNAPEAKARSQTSQNS